jgi:hypothetical protein
MCAAVKRIITYNETGILEYGYFYELDIPLGSPPLHGDLDAYPTDKLQPYAIRWPPDEYPYAEVVGTHRVAEHGCSLSKDHVTSVKYVPTSVELRYADFKGTVGFISEVTDRPLLGTRTLKENLEISPFTGWSATLLALYEVYPGPTTEIEVFLLNKDGAPCVREREVHVPDPNECPFCGYAPIVCPECKHVKYDCPQCRKHLFIVTRNCSDATDLRFCIDPPPERGMIIDVARWDGSDFIPGGIQSGFVTKRVIDWLVREDIRPFIAWPARADITDLTEEKRELLRQATVQA